MTDRNIQEAEDHILDCYETIGWRDAEIEQLRGELAAAIDVLEKIASLRRWEGSAAALAQSALDTMKALK